MLKLMAKMMKKSATRYVEFQQLKNEIEKIKYGEKGKEKLTFSKILIIFLFINFTIVEVYCLWIMFYFEDISALTTVVTTILGETLSYLIYSNKALKENISKYSNDEVKG